MSVPARLTLVTLGVADVARATSFFEALGWRKSSASNDDVSFFQLGGLALSVFGRQALADDASVSSRRLRVQRDLVGDQPRVGCEVDRVAAEWLACGGSMVKPPRARVLGWLLRIPCRISTVICGSWPTTPASRSGPTGRCNFLVT